MTLAAPARPTPAPAPWAERLFTYGVTGTNGKTSTCALISAILRADRRNVLHIGTTGAFYNDAPVAKGRTFTEFLVSIEQAALQGCRDVVIETTSLGLQRGYAKQWRFDAGVFTNLSPDHLQTHGTWENYLAAKAQLFLHLAPGRPMVLNAADPHALFVDRAAPTDIRRRWFHAPSRGPALVAPDLAVQTLELSLDGTAMHLLPSPWAERLAGHLELRMIGEVFAENALAAACVALATDVPAEAVTHGLAQCPGVPGRFECLSREPAVIVDYAHTPDALERICLTAKRLCRGRILLTFGAGGGSTPEKRHPMGAIAARYADVLVITNDNPRREDPHAIAAMIEEGARSVQSSATITIELDRGRAIEQLIDQARASDLVLIAGMGHEVGQQIGTQSTDFSDREHVRHVLEHL